MPPLFFQRFWPTVRDEVVVCVLNFLNLGISDQNMHHTNIVLIPKCSIPESMSDLRPISLCNVLYKLASKTIANRLKPLLGRIIDPCQSAFVPHRLITDNVLVAFEVNHYIKHKKKGKEGYLALKLDMSKAYDRVEWSFLERVMSRLGFHSDFIRTIMRCVSAVTYSFVLNGVTFGHINPMRGIRQGDPISPYLFLLCTECFSGLLGANSKIMGTAICRKAPRISHLLFVDDTMVFCNANMVSVSGILEVIQTYEKVSGQLINYKKSAVVFSPNVSLTVREELAARLGVPISAKHDKYLGLPSIVGASKKEIFGSFRDKIWFKIQGWSQKKLSQAGKEILIKAVLQSIPSFAMSCFMLPDSLLTEIESMIASFWWRSMDKRKIHWVGWKKMCKPKKEGGMGFRDLRAFNLALLAKQGWRIMNEPDSLLCQVLKARYFAKVDFLDAKVGYNPSLTWRSLMKAKELVDFGTRWRIGNGQNVFVWKDKWLPRPVSFKPITPLAQNDEFLRVQQLMMGDENRWNESLIRELFVENDVDTILQIPLGSGNCLDRRVWHYNTNGRFTVRSAYQVAIHDFRAQIAEPSSSFTKDWGFIWNCKVAPKIKVFAWRLSKEALATTTNLKRRHCAVDVGCPFCETENEDSRHIFVECSVARQTWALLHFPWCIISHMYNDVESWLRETLGTLDPSKTGLFLTTLWALWWNRNRKARDGEELKPDELAEFALNYFTTFADKNSMSNVPKPRAELNSWLAPECGVIKVNFDGAIFQDSCEFGFGVVARDSRGVCVGWSSARRKGVFSPECVETFAAREAAWLIKRRKWQRIILEGDCSNLFAKLQANQQDLSEAGNVIWDIKEALSLIPEVHLSCISRRGNGLAHSLARGAAAFVEGISDVDLPCID